MRDTDACLSFAGDVAFAGASPGRFCGESCCVGSLARHCWGGVLGRFCWGGGGEVAADAAPLADAGTVTVGVTVLTDAGSELPVDLAGVAAVRVASLAVGREVTFGVTGLAAAGAVSLADATGVFPAVSTVQIAVYGVRTGPLMFW